MKGGKKGKKGDDGPLLISSTLAIQKKGEDLKVQIGETHNTRQKGKRILSIPHFLCPLEEQVRGGRGKKGNGASPVSSLPFPLTCRGVGGIKENRESQKRLCNKKRKVESPPPPPPPFAFLFTLTPREGKGNEGQHAAG